MELVTERLRVMEKALELTWSIYRGRAAQLPKGNTEALKVTGESMPRRKGKLPRGFRFREPGPGVAQLRGPVLRVRKHGGSVQDLATSP